jgi:hypothetical protein
MSRAQHSGDATEHWNLPPERLHPSGAASPEWGGFTGVGRLHRSGAASPEWGCLTGVGRPHRSGAASPERSGFTGVGRLHRRGAASPEWAASPAWGGFTGVETDVNSPEADVSSRRPQGGRAGSQLGAPSELHPSSAPRRSP